MSPCDIPLRVRIFLMLSPSLLLINIIITYEILHFQTILYYNSSMIAAKQNQKFPFHFFFRFAAEGWGGRRREKNARKFFGFCTRESASVSEARIIGRQGSIQNTFELRSIHTAKIRNQKKRTKRGRAEGATLMHSPRRIQNPKGFSTLRVARRLQIQFYE